MAERETPLLGTVFVRMAGSVEEARGGEMVEGGPLFGEGQQQPVNKQATANDKLETSKLLFQTEAKERRAKAFMAALVLD